MTTISVAPEYLLAGLGALVIVVWVWRSSVRQARRAADVARQSARLASLASRVLVTAGVIVSMQWVVIHYAASNVTLLLVALGLPALFAAYTVTRALTITTFDPYPRRGGRR